MRRNNFGNFHGNNINSVCYIRKQICSLTQIFMPSKVTINVPNNTLATAGVYQFSGTGTDSFMGDKH